jgi:hypothetical protein
VADAGPSASIPSPDGAGALPAADVALPPANEPGEAQPRPFEWPPSTRVSYVLTGHYRGEVHGFASVEWIRAGDRYQVHLEVMVGLPFAPILVRRMSSDGRIDPDGLVPLRYDETTRLALRPQRSLSMRFEREAVRLADGRWKATPIGVQDTASQFVQLAFVFSREPWRLAVGRSVEVPLALPRRVDAWTYDVMAEDWVFTPFGSVRALHLKPRPLADAADTLTAEVWFAPDLRYLPVRIVIHQDAETFIDLVIARKPEVAAN